MVDHIAELNAIQQLEARIVVPGWFAQGSPQALWLQYLGSPMTIASPMLYNLLPVFTLMLKGCKCRQNDHDGSTTELLLTNPIGMQGLQNQIIPTTP